MLINNYNMQWVCVLYWPFEIYLFHKQLLIKTHKFRNILRNDSIYSFSSCCIYKKKKKAHKQKKNSAEGKANIQPSSEYISVRMRLIYFVLRWVVYRVDINNIIRVVYDVWIWWCVHFILCIGIKRGSMILK